MTAKKLIEILGFETNHALYKSDGIWYHNLKSFPGILFDDNGYIVFLTEEEYNSNVYLTRRQDLNVKIGISKVPGYINFTAEQKQKISFFKTSQENSPRSASNNQGDYEKLLEIISEDKSSLKKVFNEGKDKFLIHIIKERNNQLIAEAKEFWQKSNLLVCSVCSFNFQKVYGKLGKGFIEAHHIKPLSEVTGETKVLISDLIPICANCHRMIHRRKPWLTLEEIKIIYEKNGFEIPLSSKIGSQVT